MQKHTLFFSFSAGAIAAIALDTTVQASIPDYDFNWVNVGNAGNIGYNGPTISGREWVEGRGSVSYDYRIAKDEITTSQWVDFINTFTTQSQSMAFFIQAPFNWGAQSDLSYLGPGRKYTLKSSATANWPVGGISWRDAARYCNWLQNGKSSNVNSLVTGAYDTTTWGAGASPGTFTDAPTRLPGAQFFLPNFDEYLKAAHYDPVKNGTGGWWLYDNRSDISPVSGVPGLGTTSAGTGSWFIPLGSYPQSASAYGLLDLSGGANEWLENYAPGETGRYRLWDGSSISDFDTTVDLPYQYGTEFPNSVTLTTGLRIASIPTSGSSSVLALWLAVALRRRRDASATLRTFDPVDCCAHIQRGPSGHRRGVPTHHR